MEEYTSLLGGHSCIRALPTEYDLDETSARVLEEEIERTVYSSWR